jgi:hypothetical protein
LSDHATQPAAPAAQSDEQLVALLAEYETVDQIMAAARKVRDAGYQVWDVHSPFPIHGIDKAMGLKPSILPWLVLGGGIAGCLAGIGLVWYTNAHDYPFLISGKPLFSLPANIPVIFETTVLLAAFAAVFGMLGLNHLPMLFNPLFKKARFRRATDDRFFVVIEVADEKFDAVRTRELLESTHPVAIEEVQD